jgi:hypothetical protein
MPNFINIGSVVSDMKHADGQPNFLILLSAKNAQMSAGNVRIYANVFSSNLTM